MRDLKHLIFFEDLLQDANNALVQQACAQGKLALAYNCSYIPEVLLDVESKTITLSLSINTDMCAVMDYFEIFLQRMLLFRRAAEQLGLSFRLEVNGQLLL